MRLGVLDVGSNTVHLLVVDAHRGGHPTPTRSVKTMLRLAEHLDANGELTAEGSDELIRVIAEAAESAAELECEDLMAFATSAVRDAPNSLDVLARVRTETGVTLDVLSGEQEARLTFLAARRWYGWSAGRLLVLDIGGGSLEIAAGIDEEPDAAVSLPLGAARLSREWFSSDPPRKRELEALRAHLDEVLAGPVAAVHKVGPPDRVVATSKTFRSLGRLTGAAPSSAGPRVRRTLSQAGLRQVTEFIRRMTTTDLGELEGVSPGRAHQLGAGALVADAAMRAVGAEEVQLCPWALREGVILRRLDWLEGIDRTSQRGRRPTRNTGRTVVRGAR